MSDASKRGKSSRRKGKEFERTVVRYYNSLFGEGAAVRNIQTRSGTDGADVDLLERFHLECKANERLNFWAAIRQAERDVRKGRIPTVIAKRNGKRPVAAMPLGSLDFLLRSDVLLCRLSGALERGNAEEIEEILTIVYTHQKVGYVANTRFSQVEKIAEALGGNELAGELVPSE